MMLKRDRALRGAAGGELHHEDWDAEEHEAGEIGEDEESAAELPRDGWKTPHVPQADRAPGGQEDEANSTCKLFSHG